MYMKFRYAHITKALHMELTYIKPVCIHQNYTITATAFSISESNVYSGHLGYTRCMSEVSLISWGGYGMFIGNNEQKELDQES